MNRMTMKKVMMAATLLNGVFSASRAEEPMNSVGEQNGKTLTKSVKELQEDFLKLKFGMFIHFNLETFKGVQWVAGYHSPADFAPGGKIDTDAWADAAKSAGMKYAVLTVKHVSGFCLWDSKYTTYDVMNPECPYQQDLVAQFIKSFTSRGLKVGLYYCWRHPGFGDLNKFKVLPPECDPAKYSIAEQIEFQKKQVAELVEKYPDAFYIWNDALDPDIMPAEQATAFIRSLRPGLLASANWWDTKKSLLSRICGSILRYETLWTLDFQGFRPILEHGYVAHESSGPPCGTISPVVPPLGSLSTALHVRQIPCFPTLSAPIYLPCYSSENPAVQSPVPESPLLTHRFC